MNEIVKGDVQFRAWGRVRAGGRLRIPSPTESLTSALDLRQSHVLQNSKEIVNINSHRNGVYGNTYYGTSEAAVNLLVGNDAQAYPRKSRYIRVEKCTP